MYAWVIDFIADKGKEKWQQPCNISLNYKICRWNNIWIDEIRIASKVLCFFTRKQRNTLIADDVE